MNRTLLNTIGDAIVRLNQERGYTFCVIEHDMDFIGRLCDPVIVMAEGKVLAEGTVDQVKNDERVIEAYLGTGLKNKAKAEGFPVDILHACTIAVEPGEIAVIVGPNGAGKSTAMKAVFGMLRLRGGQVRLAGEDITALSPQARVAKGMAFVPQTSNIFTSMTVEENLEMGAFLSPS